MIDKSKLKELALAAKRGANYATTVGAFTEAANPAAILELLAELETTQLAGAARQGGNTCDLTDYGTPVTYSNGTGASPDPSAKQEPKLVPKWAGEFRSHADWVNRAQRVLSVPSHKPPAVCVDAKGRRCFIGADMARARDEGAFPVRYFWECELAAPSASASPAAPIVPQAVRDAVARMCQPLDESRLSGATAKADAFCMGIIKEFIDSLSAAPVAGSQQVPSKLEVECEVLEHWLSIAAEPIGSDCCGQPDVGAQYGGMNEQVCCGNPEPAFIGFAAFIDAMGARHKAVIAELAAAAPAVPVPEEQGWQPIETAPKDGTSILLYTGEGQIEARWSYGRWEQSPCYATYDGAGGVALSCEPTHWKTLDAAPSLQQPKEGSQP